MTYFELTRPKTSRRIFYQSTSEIALNTANQVVFFGVCSFPMTVINESMYKEQRIKDIRHDSKRMVLHEGGSTDTSQ